MSAVRETDLPGVLLFEGNVFRDARGAFREIWRESDFANAVHGVKCVQDNVSVSAHNVLRGLHLQCPNGQGKLITVLAGEVFDVAVDVRSDSPQFARWIGENLSSENGRQLYVPPGFAHGFVVLSDSAVVSYKCTEYYRSDSELTVRWDDPRIGIDWPAQSPVLSDKDRAAPTLAEIPRHRLPTLQRT